MSEYNTDLPSSLIESWILQYYVFEVWSRFIQNLPVENSLRLGAVVCNIACDEVTDEKDRKLCNLVEFMAKISKAVRGNVFEESLSAPNSQTCKLTVFEEAIDLLTVIGHNFAGKLDTKVMSETKQKLRYYAVLVLCRDGKFEMADIVMKRQWCYWKNSDELEKRNHLCKLINGKKMARAPHNNQSIVDSVRQLLAPIMAENPFLVNIGQQVAEMLAEHKSAEQASMARDEEFDVKPNDKVTLHPTTMSPKKCASNTAAPDFGNDITSPPKLVKISPKGVQLKSVIEDSQSITDGEDAPSPGLAPVVEESARAESSDHDCHIDSDDTASDLSINFEETFSSSTSCSTKKSKHRKKTPWGKDDEDLIYKGVQFYGFGNWAEIARKYFPKRSNVDVKDKWRTMLKQNKVADLEKKYGPVYK